MRCVAQKRRAPLGPLRHRIAHMQRRSRDIVQRVQQLAGVAVEIGIGTAQILGIAGQRPAFLGPILLRQGGEDEDFPPPGQREGHDLLFRHLAPPLGEGVGVGKPRGPVAGERAAIGHHCRCSADDPRPRARCARPSGCRPRRSPRRRPRACHRQNPASPAPRQAPARPPPFQGAACPRAGARAGRPADRRGGSSVAARRISPPPPHSSAGATSPRR